MIYRAADLFDLSQTDHVDLFRDCKHPWDALKRLAEYVGAVARHETSRANIAVGAHVGLNVIIGEGTVVEHGATIIGPAIIGSHCQIRHNAYIRENSIVGNDCVVGNSTEIKHSILFNKCQTPHFNYVGDSILGHRSHLGAGAILSNVKLDNTHVFVDVEGTPVDTGLRKFGALIGDHSDVGCNSVLNPGSIIGRGSLIYPNVCWRGFLPAHMIAKNKASPVVVVRRPRES
jgi:NDP-sugar pyrophosphorylase family protein